MRDACIKRLPEIFILGLMAVLLWSNLSLLLTVDVWRNDSMYYVSSYDDKLSDEGRWINHLFFRFLQLVPSDLAILISYFCVIIFTAVVAYRVTKNIFFSTAFGILCALTPVLPVQLEWPETLLFGFITLALSPMLQTKLPERYFFPVVAILFMGTFSAFYFLMPLLFLSGMNYSRFWRLLLVWVLAFVMAYVVTNCLIYALTGNFIQLASWRNPHYLHSVDDLLLNLENIQRAIHIHAEKMESFLKKGVLALLLLASVVVSIRKKQYWLPVIAIICSLGVYASTLPVGIYIQDRTTLTAFIGLFVALFLAPYTSRKALLVIMIIMFILAVRMAKVGHEGISWYKSYTEMLTTQIMSVIAAPPEEAWRVFVVAEMAESQKMFSMIDRNIAKKNLYSEGFSHPQYWVPVMKKLGYTQFRVCPDLQGWDCDQIASSYQEREKFQREQGLFISRRLPGGDVLLMINPLAIK